MIDKSKNAFKNEGLKTCSKFFDLKRKQKEKRKQKTKTKTKNKNKNKKQNKTIQKQTNIQKLLRYLCPKKANIFFS